MLPATPGSAPARASRGFTGIGQQNARATGIGHHPDARPRGTGCMASSAATSKSSSSVLVRITRLA